MKYYADLMPHVSWSMEHLLEYGRVFMSRTWHYSLTPMQATSLLNLQSSYIVAKSHGLGVRLTDFYKIICLTSQIRISPKSHGHLIQHEKNRKNVLKHNISYPIFFAQWVNTGINWRLFPDCFKLSWTRDSVACACD